MYSLLHIFFKFYMTDTYADVVPSKNLFFKLFFVDILFSQQSYISKPIVHFASEKNILSCSPSLEFIAKNKQTNKTKQKKKRLLKVFFPVSVAMHIKGRLFGYLLASPSTHSCFACFFYFFSFLFFFFFNVLLLDKVKLNGLKYDTFKRCSAKVCLIALYFH